MRQWGGRNDRPTPLFNLNLSYLVVSALIGSALLVPTQTVIDEAHAETLHDIATRVAVEYKIPEQTLFNLVESESNWNPGAVGDKGCSFGLVQINVCANNNPKEKYYATKEQALDPEFALRYAAKAIKAGDESRWTPCNCYSYVSILTDIEGRVTPNSTPKDGSVVEFDYNGVPHFGYITKLDVEGFTIREANYEPCKTGTRFVKWNDPAIRGFYKPTTSPETVD